MFQRKVIILQPELKIRKKMKSYAYFYGYYFYFAENCEAGSCA